MPWRGYPNHRQSRWSSRMAVIIKAGHPLFSTIIVDCDVVVYLDISDELLAEHCKKRGNDFTDSKNVKKAVEHDWNSHREKGEKTFYYLVLVE